MGLLPWHKNSHHFLLSLHGPYSLTQEFTLYLFLSPLLSLVLWHNSSHKFVLSLCWVSFSELKVHNTFLFPFYFSSVLWHKFHTMIFSFLAVASVCDTRVHIIFFFPLPGPRPLPRPRPRLAGFLLLPIHLEQYQDSSSAGSSFTPTQGLSIKDNQVIIRLYKPNIPTSENIKLICILCS